MGASSEEEMQVATAEQSSPLPFLAELETEGRGTALVGEGLVHLTEDLRCFLAKRLGAEHSACKAEATSFADDQPVSQSELMHTPASGQTSSDVDPEGMAEQDLHSGQCWARRQQH